MNISRRDRPANVIRLLGILLLIALLAVGCGRRAAKPTPEPRTLQFLVFGLNQPSLESYERLAETFHKEYPHLTVEVKGTTDLGGFQQALQGDADAVAFLPWGISDLDSLLPLDPFISREPPDFLTDFLPQALDAVRYQGQIIALPVDWDTNVLYYNQTLFDAERIPYPEAGWTWSDFLLYAQMLTRLLPDDSTQYGFYAGDLLWLSFVVEEVGEDLFRFDTLRLDSEPMMRAIQRYTDLVLVHGVMPSASEYAQQYRQIGDLVSAGRVGMWLGSITERGGRSAVMEWGFPWGVAPLPRGNTGRSYSQMLMFGIPASFSSAGDPADAWRWLAFLSKQPEHITGLPVRRSLLEDSDFRLTLGTEQEADIYMQMVTEAAPIPLALEIDTPYIALNRAVEKILSGDMSVEDALSEAQRTVEAIGR